MSGFGVLFDKSLENRSGNFGKTDHKKNVESYKNKLSINVVISL